MIIYGTVFSLCIALLIQQVFLRKLSLLKTILFVFAETAILFVSYKYGFHLIIEGIVLSVLVFYLLSGSGDVYKNILFSLAISSILFAFRTISEIVVSYISLWEVNLTKMSGELFLISHYVALIAVVLMTFSAAPRLRKLYAVKYEVKIPLIILSELIIHFGVLQIENVLYRDMYNGYQISIIFVCLVILSVLITFGFAQLYKSKITELEKQFEIELLDSQIMSNEKLIEREKELYKIQHDIKHYLHLILNDGFLNDDIDHIKKIYDEYCDMEEIHTSSKVVDHVINIKKRDAAKREIDITVETNLEDKIPIKETELSLLLSNLLDNAITHNIESGFIKVSISSINGSFMIRVLNSCYPADVEISDITHGYGLQTIDQIVQNYNGSFYNERRGSQYVSLVYI